MWRHFGMAYFINIRDLRLIHSRLISDETEHSRFIIGALKMILNTENFSFLAGGFYDFLNKSM
jgi:hypothetical protein